MFFIDGQLFIESAAPKEAKSARYPHPFLCVYCQAAYLLDYDSSMEPNDLNILRQIAQMIADREHVAGHNDLSVPIAITNRVPR
jgi:hypothetical protein